MKVLTFTSKNSIVIVKTLKKGGVVVTPTETSYGMAVDVTNRTAVKRLYKIKGRDFNKPVHVFVSSRAQARQLIVWNKKVEALTKKFWPGPLTIVSKLKVKSEKYKVLTAGTGFLGVRVSPNPVVLKIVTSLKSPITGTSANVSGRPDCYSAEEVKEQFRRKKYKPDILINSGTLVQNKPSTVIKVDGEHIEVLREGPISAREIQRVVSSIK